MAARANELWKQSECEYFRQKSKQIFERVRPTWIDVGQWVAPDRTNWLLYRDPGARKNHHIVDITHRLALRSFTSGFLDGNTSTSRPWFAIVDPDPDINGYSENRQWLDRYTERCLATFSGSNFYNSEALFYYEYGTFNNGCQYIEEIQSERLHYHNLEPGSYYVMNNAYGLPIILVREFSMSVQALVKRYGKKDPRTGKYLWENFSDRVRRAYETGNYAVQVDVVNIVRENEYYDVNVPPVGNNRPWVSLHYELGGVQSNYAVTGEEFGTLEDGKERKYLEVNFSKRKPFVLGRGHVSGNFEWAEEGPSTMALGSIKSLNKKAISKDVAMEQMLSPTYQGPSGVNKTHLTNQSNRYIPLNPTDAAQGGIRPINPINPAVATINADVMDLRQMVDKAYYADFLLYLSKNPKTRTAEETRAIIAEQQLVIGPNLQSLDWTHNVPHLDYVMDFVLDNDPYLPPIPEGLQGRTLKVDFISTFAQAQKAADLPSVFQYVTQMLNVAQLSADPRILDKVDFDKFGDILEDRLYLPAGLNRDQDKVESMRQRQQAAAERTAALQQTLPAVAGAVKDSSQSTT